MNTTMKKSAVIVDSINETITITKAYYKKACSYGSSEYYEFRQIKSDNAGFAIQFKTIEKKTYKDLTFKVSPTNFKHTGIFPEQAVNWDYVMNKIKTKKKMPINDMCRGDGCIGCTNHGCAGKNMVKDAVKEVE